MRGHAVFTIFIIFAFVRISNSRVINIPADYPTIQAGIDTAVNGDTVLAAPGEYHERINFGGRNIVVGSRYLTEADTAFISSTIIDGDSAGTVVTFESAEDSSATLVGFTIRRGFARFAGGISLYNARPRIVSNWISGNYSDYGGGGIDCFMADPLILGNVVTENDSRYRGRGIMCNWSDAIIRDNEISGNFGHGISLHNNSRATVEGNNIQDNADYGIECDRSEPLISSNAVIQNDEIGIYASNGAPVIRGNRIGRNGRAGISLSRAPCEISQNTIYKNSMAHSGANIGLTFSSARIIGNVIAGNVQEDGSGIHCSESAPDIRNTIIWGNAGAFEVYGDSTPTVSYCDIQGGRAGEGNMEVNPLFENPSFDDYDLCAASPCIDAGDPNLTDPDDSRSDIGVYEESHPACSDHPMIHVSVSGDDTSGDGSEARPFRTIQRGIDYSANGDTILAHRGVYRENINFSGKDVCLVSRYVFTRDSADIFGTVIEGDSVGTVVSFIWGESAASLVGFTITRGGNSGIRCLYSNPTIAHNVIADNWAEAGGGIHCERSDPLILANVITGNVATSEYPGGGGIRSFWGEPRIVGNVIAHNSALGCGGGMHLNCLDDDPPVIANNVVAFNRSDCGAGAYIVGNDSRPLAISNCVFYADTAEYGGAIYLNFGDMYVVNSVFRDNEAPHGGDIWHQYGTYLVDYCNVQGPDPLFRDPAAGDFHLQSVACGDAFDSPCIDGGHPDSVDIQLDCARGLGAPRADLGAYGGGDSTFIVRIDERPPLPGGIGLLQNYPNPFNAATAIGYFLPSPRKVQIDIFDILGRRVATLTPGFRPAGFHSVTWDAGGVSAGLYFYRLTAGDFTEAKKCLLVK